LAECRGETIQPDLPAVLGIEANQKGRLTALEDPPLFGFKNLAPDPPLTALDDPPRRPGLASLASSHSLTCRGKNRTRLVPSKTLRSRPELTSVSINRSEQPSHWASCFLEKGFM